MLRPALSGAAAVIALAVVVSAVPTASAASARPAASSHPARPRPAAAAVARPAAAQPAAVTVRPARPARGAPSITVLRTARNGPSRGYIFSGPKYDVGGPADPKVGVLITDNKGRPVYFHQVARGLRAFDVKRQTYRGKAVLTYWLGSTQPGAVGVGDGAGYILNNRYQVIKIVHSPSPEGMDLHEFDLTPSGNALFISYNRVRTNATAEGGAANQLTFDCVVYEVNVATNKVIFRWNSLAHVPLADSFLPAPTTTSGAPAPNVPYDYFHLNSVKPDTDGNLLISSRSTWTLYKVSRKTGKIMWRLGGKQSSFKAGGSLLRFAWQHDAEPLGNNEYRIFDNESDAEPGGSERAQSRVEWIKLDPVHHTAKAVRVITHPGAKLLVGSQGNAQSLPHGATFVDYGAINQMSEYTGNGTLVFNARFTQKQSSYRAYLAPWNGAPTTGPNLRRNGNQLDAIWDGDAAVVRWRIMGGTSRHDLRMVGHIAWRGFDTAFRLAPRPRFVQVLAIDRKNRVIGRSQVVAFG